MHEAELQRLGFGSPTYTPEDKGDATCNHSGKILNALAGVLQN